MKKNEILLPKHGWISGDLLRAAAALQNVSVIESVFDFILMRRGNVNDLSAIQRKKLLHSDLFARNLSDLYAEDTEALAYVLGNDFSVPRDAAEQVKVCYETKKIVEAPIPIACGNGVFCVVSDIKEGRLDAEIAPFGPYFFTAAAIKSSAYWAMLFERLTVPLLEFGKQLRFAALTSAGISTEQAKAFSEDVCSWGGRSQIAHALDSQQIAIWLTRVITESLDVEQAINEGVAIKGLGISFASKHLRFLDPARFATFDSLLKQVVDEKNFDAPAFSRFLDGLEQVKYLLALEDDIATIELGIFRLIRPFFDESQKFKPTKRLAPSNSVSMASVSAAALDREWVRVGLLNPSIALYAKPGLTALYGFSEGSRNQAGRIPMRLFMFMGAKELECKPVLAIDHFGFDDLGLRKDLLLPYMRFWASTHFGCLVLALSVDI